MSPIAFDCNAKQMLQLGPLEVEVMEVIWKIGASRVRDVLQRLDRKLAYTTVLTVLDRLYRKRLVDREMTDRAFVYSARISGAEWRLRTAAR